MKAITDVDYGAIYKDLGLNTDLAKAFGLQKSVIKAEAEQLADGLADYSEAQVTQVAPLRYAVRHRTEQENYNNHIVTV